MINKFPKRLNKKWNRFNKIEKIFIIYVIVLAVSFVFLPVLKTVDVNTLQINQTFSLFNKNLWILDIFIIFNLFLLFLRNISFRFRKLIYVLIWFRENEWLVNLWILINLLIILISIWSTINFLNSGIFSSIKLHWWYYILSILLIIGLIYNLILSLNFSHKRKNANLVNIVRNKYETTEEKIREEVLFKM